MELKSGIVSTSRYDTNTLKYAMGNNDPTYESFQAQLRWAAEELNRGFYDRYTEENLTQIVLRDGTVVEPPPGVNAGTYALLRFLAIDVDESQWHAWVSLDNDGFYQTYTSLFGSPAFSEDGQGQATPNTTNTPSNLRLPWGNGETWYYTGGPHDSYTGGRYYNKTAIDFAPGGGSGCFNSSAWVRASDGGTVKYANCNFVRVEHSGGWSTTYFHLSDIQVSVGQHVSAGAALGHPSCGVGASCGWSGSATGSHTHFDIRLNNIPQAIDGTNIGGWTIHKATSDYRGTMTAGGTTKNAAWWRKDSYNSIRAYANDTDTDDGRTLTSGQTVNGTRSPGTDTDVYYINGTSGQMLTVEMWKSSGSSLDTYVYVRDPSNRVVGVDDDGGSGYNSRLVVTLRSSGRFRIHAKGYGSSTGAYQLKATLSSGGGSDNEDGRWLSHNRTRNGTLNSNSDEDTYYFHGVAGRIISIRMWKDGSSVDSYLELYSPSGSRIGRNDDGGGNRNSWLVAQLGSSGTYRVKARSYNHASSGDYEIRLRSVDANNFAEDKRVWASSVENGSYMPHKAVDENIGTRWSSQFRDRQWIYVDLGANRNVDMVILRWERAYAKRYGIYYWTGSDWRNVYWTNHGNGGTDLVKFSPKTTRYILVYGYERGTPWGVSLWEFGVYNSTQATPPTVEPEDPEKTPDSVTEDPPPPATSPGKDEGVMALTVGEDGYQEFTPEEDTWAGDTPEGANHESAGTPVALIQNIHFDDTTLPGPDDVFSFIGAAEDTDSDGTGDPIVAYEWQSNLDGILSTQAEFTATARMLSSGVHTITFRAQDNEGIWSQEDAWPLTIESLYRVHLPLIIKQ
jgi:murein DD-endopeptidase MepM/ murein hydrolase activator NlpD